MLTGSDTRDEHENEIIFYGIDLSELVRNREHFRYFCNRDFVSFYNSQLEYCTHS